MTRSRNIAIHIIGWALFLILPLVFSPGPAFSSHGIPHFLKRELIACVLLIGYFYLSAVLVSEFYFKGKYTLFFLLAFVCFLVTTLVPFLFIPGHPDLPVDPQFPRPPGDDNSILMEFGHNFFRFSVVTFVSLTLKISNRWKQAEQEKLNAELSYLKAQINPHFLFNTLNSIYSLSIQKSDHTPSAIVKLSSMMRYVVSESSRDFVSLEKELNYIRNYIELQQLRFGDAIQLLFFVDGSSGAKRIAPLILIPFVENAFKHGINAEEISKIKVSIEVDNHELRLEVYNKKVVVRKDEEKSGLGIENTRNRLQLLYPDRHILSITDAKEDFSVLLTIRLK